MKFSDIKIGQKAEIVHKITHSDILNFLILTNDSNAIHLNGEYAKSKGHKGQVAYGMLTASFISTLIGTKLPGNGSLWESQKIRFVTPVSIGDTITVKAEVVGKEGDTRTVRMITDVYNQDGEPVILGAATIKVLE